MPLKSLTRGSASEKNLSTNSYILSPRSVTFAPMCMPARSLKFETDFLAVVGTAFWPVIIVRSSMMLSMTLELSFASPAPTLTTTFSSRGICIGLL